MVAFHFALFVAAAFVLWKRGLGRGMALLGLGSFLGFAPTGGFWAWTLFRRLGNPVFPFANGLFRSPYYRPEDFTSSLYATRTPFDLVRPAVDLALGPRSGCRRSRCGTDASCCCCSWRWSRSLS